MTAKPNEAMRDFWSGEGGQNWVSREDRLEASLKIFGQQAIDVAEISSDDRILDIGFGCGETSLDLARLTGLQGHVHGVDISTTMVETAQLKARTSGVANVSFECADAQTAEFPTDEYDRVFSRFGVMFFDDPAGAFQNIFRALKPGGRLSFVCWAGRDQNEWVGRPLEVVAKHLTLPLPPAPDAPGPFSLSDQSRLRNILSKAGFSRISVAPFHGPLVLGDDIGEAVSFLMELAPSGSAVKQAEPDEDLRAAIAADMTEMLKSCKSAQGVSMGATALRVSASKV